MAREQDKESDKLVTPREVEVHRRQTLRWASVAAVSGSDHV